jgi:GTP cyclohydrolase II
MFKQLGISSVELLISLSIVSSMTAFTLSLAEEVEISAKQYQEETNVKEMMKKIRSSK